MKAAVNTVYRSTAAGVLAVSSLDGVIVSIRFIPDMENCDLTGQSAVADLAVAQIEEYLSGRRRILAFPISAEGTAFQQRIWEQLSRIPYGEVRSYGEIAAAAGSPKAARAVGMACNRNPLPIVIPCHRVVGSDGSLTGYAGGLELKKKLLEIEGVSI